MKKITVAGISAVSIAVGSVAVAAAVPIGAALATNGEATTSTQPESDAAANTGPEGLFGRIDRGMESVLDSLVDDGTITEAQAEAITERFVAKAEEARLEFQEKHPRLAEARERFAERGEAFRMHLGAQVDELSQFLGLSTDELKERLATESLADIAGDKTPELVTILTAKANARIDQAVADGKLSEERAASIKEQTAERIEQGLHLIGGNTLREHLKGFLEGRGGN